MQDFLIILDSPRYFVEFAFLWVIACGAIAGFRPIRFKVKRYNNSYKEGE